VTANREIEKKIVTTNHNCVKTHNFKLENRLAAAASREKAEKIQAKKVLSQLEFGLSGASWGVANSLFKRSSLRSPRDIIVVFVT